MRYIRWASIVVLVISTTPSLAQFGGMYLTPTPSVGMGYGLPYMGYGWGIGPRLSNYGNFGPRPVTWYVPGQGYSTYVANGLPWQGSAVQQRTMQYPSSVGMGMDGMIARNDRYMRRLETLYALQEKAYADSRRPVREPSTLAASAKEVEPPQPKKTRSTSKKAVSKDEPTRVVPLEGTTPSADYSNGDAETLSPEKKLFTP